MHKVIIDCASSFFSLFLDPTFQFQNLQYSPIFYCLLFTRKKNNNNNTQTTTSFVFAMTPPKPLSTNKKQNNSQKQITRKG